MAGGWAQAARLPVHEALTWAAENLRERAWDSYHKTLQIWASTLPAYSMGGDPPEPPDPPEDFD